jgi:hypothetical protein
MNERKQHVRGIQEADMFDSKVELALKTPKPRRSTAVSQVLRAITTQDLLPDVWQVMTAEGNSEFSVRVASDHDTRRKAYALAYRVYRRCGYVEESTTQLCVSPYDAFTGTITLLAEDKNGREIGTVSLVFDSPLGLPCSEIYGEEVNAVRNQGRKLVEVTRLAIEEDAPNPRNLLLHLFSLSYIFARHVGGCTDMIIEVNPRHVDYYRRFLRFDQIGPERPCPRVKDAPAVLMCMNFSHIEAALQGHAGGRDKNGKRLHPYPFTREDEMRAARFLSGHHTPMTFHELIAFKIAGAMPV